MHRRNMVAIGAIMLLVALGGCGKGDRNTNGKGSMAGQGERPSMQGLRHITPAEAEAMIRDHAGDDSFVLLDIRRPEEYAAGHLAGARELDFYSPTFGDDLAALDTDKTYLIYCRTGHRTGITLGLMKGLGFQDVADMAGGITRWQGEGRPVIE